VSLFDERASNEKHLIDRTTPGDWRSIARLRYGKI
jgi:hypothetical protein